MDLPPRGFCSGTHEYGQPENADPSKNAGPFLFLKFPVTRNSFLSRLFETAVPVEERYRIPGRDKVLLLPKMTAGILLSRV
jgi:hypothetical protein